MDSRFRDVQKHFRDGDKVNYSAPDRKQLPNFIYLGVQPPELKIEVHRLLDQLGMGYNDIGSDDYAVSKKFASILESFPEDYIQIMLQEAINGGLVETDYCLPKHTSVTNILRPYIKDFFRARIAVLHPGQTIDYHIDTNTTQMCRVQFPIQAEQHWSIKRGTVIEEKILKPGEIWFVNTGFAHKVVNEEGIDRITVLLGCKYEYIKERIDGLGTDS
jgi:hypothetical protein